MKHLCRLFLTLSLLVCLVPFAGMSLRPTVESAENRVLSAFPSFTKRDGRVNIAFFQQFDTWFSEHFAFRNELVFLDSVVQSDIFHSSANEKVIVGRDGWLYYASTLPDYQGTGLVSEREICSMAHNLKLTERFVREHGAKLLLAFPANKNTLYGNFMPWYCPAPDGTAHNLFRLQDRLAALGLPYADLHGLFSKEPEILYHRQDSHWNSKGAMLAYTLMMDRLSLPHEDFAALPVTRALTHEGDLGRMLYTFYGKKGADYAYALDGRYEIVEAAGQTGDGWIETAGTAGRGTLLMFRDSFTDALLPFFASSFNGVFHQGAALRPRDAAGALRAGRGDLREGRAQPAGLSGHAAALLRPGGGAAGGGGGAARGDGALPAHARKRHGLLLSQRHGGGGAQAGGCHLCRA